MFVSDILKSKGGAVVTASKTDTIRSVLTVLRDNKIGALVVGENGRVDGILSERDIVHLIATDGAAALDKTVETAMTREVVTCTPCETIDRVMAMMTKGRFRHVPVLEDGALVGVVSIGDVVKRRIAETEREAEALKQYIAT